MKTQKSFHEEDTGILYVVPTPIGNLEDITYRSLTVLKTASIIAAEDTRNTKKLLNHFSISTPLISYHEHNKMAREGQLISRLKTGETIALVSDAGMPGISDPGYEIVRAAIREGQKVVVLPGANAALCALVGSGLPTNEFYFYGFLPRKKKEKIDELERLQTIQATLLFYESPYRVTETLIEMNRVFGPREVSLARELTKRFEEYIRGSLEEVIAWAENTELKGEFCIVVEGNKNTGEDDNWWNDLSLKAHVIYYMEKENMPSKLAIKQVSLDRNLPKREVYQAYHIED